MIETPDESGEEQDRRELARAKEGEEGEERARGEVVEEQRQQIIEVLEARLHQGPLPSGEAMAEYDRARPGTSDEIVEEWHAEARHRRELQRLTVTRALRNRDRGQWIGAGLALLVIIGGFAAIFTGHSLAGLAALIVAAAAVAGRFLVQRGNNRQPSLPQEAEPPKDE